LTANETRQGKSEGCDARTPPGAASPRATWYAHLDFKTWSGLLRRLRRWWLEEFLALFPRRVSEWLVGRGGNAVVLSIEETSIDILLRNYSGQALASASIPQANYSASALDNFMRTHRVTRKSVALGLRLPLEKFFTRKLVLPLEAAPSIDEIVARDLTLKTPFKLADIYHDFAMNNAAEANKIVVSQWVTRRAFVHEAAVAAEIEPSSIAFVECDVQFVGDPRPPSISIQRSSGGGNSWLRMSALALIVSAVLLSIATGSLTFWRQQSTLDELDNRISVEKTKAQQVRTVVSKLESAQSLLLRVRMRKSEIPGLLDIWEETTRILPSHSWLIELRLSEMPQQNERRFAMSGFSPAAASLVGLVDSSPLFTEASLAAPVSIDSAEERERFVIQAKLRRSGARRVGP